MAVLLGKTILAIMAFVGGNWHVRFKTIFGDQLSARLLELNTQLDLLCCSQQNDPSGMPRFIRSPPDLLSLQAVLCLSINHLSIMHQSHDELELWLYVQ